MSSTPHVLAPASLPSPAPDADSYTVAALRKIGKFWHIPAVNKLPSDQLRREVAQAFREESVAQAVISSLPGDQRTVLAVFRRHGGAVHGEVLRLDLLARGALQITEQSLGLGRPWRRWKSNPVEYLAERAALLRYGSRYGSSHFGGYGSEAENPFPPYRLHPLLLRLVSPASPPPWSLSPVTAPVEELPGSPPALTALYLRRLTAQLATHIPMKLTRRGLVAQPSLTALAKAVPIPPERDFHPPAVQALGLELLRAAGVLVSEAEERLVVDPARADRLFEAPDFDQVRSWVRGWLHTSGWLDGVGVMAIEENYSSKPAPDERQVLAWYLTGLASQEDRPWTDLVSFLDAVYTTRGQRYGSLEVRGWNPDLPTMQDWEKLRGEERDRAVWLAHTGRWYANALMVTLPWLGVVERGRSGVPGAPGWCFRLTPLGRAVFASPDPFRIPAEPDDRFLVVQPNLDVVAYLDRATCAQAAVLGCLTESEPKKILPTGPVQTVRLTAGSVYLALENGIDQGRILDFLQRHAQNELPANVVRSLQDWSARRESLVVREHVDFLAFPSAAEAAAHVERQGGQLLGDRSVLLTGPASSRKPAKALVVDHVEGMRKTWTVDEEGRITHSGPLDLVQSVRLWRIAEAKNGWRLTRARVATAVKAGVKSDLIRFWIQNHLAKPLPAVLECTLVAWAGTPLPAALADAVVLHLPVSEQLKAVRASARFQPHLLRQVGPGWLLVRRESRAAVAALLEELGFVVGEDFSAAADPAECDAE